MSDSPKVFISHAREDKVGYAEPLAKELLAQGVDAWLDRWELRPGDSLTQKIFEEGLSQAGTCVFLMSRNSVDKPWAKAELENAIAQRVDGRIRLIPVKLEDCAAPNAVSDILWLDLARYGTIEVVATEIAKVVFGHSDKPPVGPKPAWATSASLQLPGLDKQDGVVLGLVYEVALYGHREAIQGGELVPLAEPLGISFDDLYEATQILCEHGYLIDHDTCMQPHLFVELPAVTLLSIATHFGQPVEQLRAAIAALIINEGIGDVAVIQEHFSDCPPGLLDAIIDDLEGMGYVQVARPLGGRGYVMEPSASFRRWLRNQA